MYLCLKPSKVDYVWACFVLQDVAAICSGLPALTALNLSSNRMSHSVVGISHLTNLRILVLNNTGINWSQVRNVFLTSICLD